ncbi:ankyrin repeat domain-containing protein [Stenotrophomonas sp.]|uniref:ankyrin repeat domain-containing protein n=1 Tax=Stenotrophomonas sp. TaxID=69392 RepID=UPI0028ABEAEC|nr:ankyrin repeat domain-containing protein [Stenotrophomonas sp.]
MLLADLLEGYGQLPEYSGITLADVDQISLFGDVPINVAATRGSIVEMETLLSVGADLDSPGEHGCTPLHNAVEQGARDAVEWLILNGANRSAINDWGMSPSDLAAALGESLIGGLLK